MLNNVEMIGFLKDDPKLEFTGKDGATPMTRFTLCVDEVFWDPDDESKTVTTNFIGCVALRENAEQIAEAYRKGDQIEVHGHLSQREIPGVDGKADRRTRVSVHWVRGVMKSRRSPGPRF